MWGEKDGKEEVHFFCLGSVDEQELHEFCPKIKDASV
jgi:hypothetical protein